MEKLRPRRIAFLCSALILQMSASGCRPTDGWRRYLSGGNYPSYVFGVDAACQSLVVSSPISGHGDIYRFGLNDGTHEQLTFSDEFESDPIISPDGKAVVFSRDLPDRTGLWIDRAGKQTALTSGDFFDTPMKFSADGQYILARRVPTSSRVGGCVILAVDDREFAEVPLPGVAEFAPDSVRYCYARYDPKQKRSELWIGNLEDRTEKQLGYGTHSEWSSDGEHILCATGRGEERVLITVVDGKSVSLGETSLATFLGIGLKVVYTDARRRQIWVRDPQVDKAERVLSTESATIERIVATQAGLFCHTMEPGDRVGKIVLVDVAAKTSVDVVDIAACRFLASEHGQSSGTRRSSDND